jgi:hypothetical protein
VTCLSFEIDNGPVLLTLLNVAEIEINRLVASYTTGEQHGQERPIPLLLQALAAGSLPQSPRLLGGEPVP